MKQDDLNKDTLAKALKSESRNLSLHVFRELDSTNNEAKRLVMRGAAETACVVAEHQTAGRGRLGRSFFSPADTGVYFSILYTSNQRRESLISITSAASVAVMRAIRACTGRQAQIKWVNDLYLDGKKICGILTEALTDSSAVTSIIIGIGINLSTTNFPPELADKAGSIGAPTVLRAELIAEIWNQLKPFLENPQNRSWLSDYRTHSCVIEKPITWVQGEHSHTGIACGINEQGELEVRLPNGEITVLRTGEISVFVN